MKFEVHNIESSPTPFGLPARITYRVSKSGSYISAVLNVANAAFAVHRESFLTSFAALAYAGYIQWRSKDDGQFSIFICDDTIDSADDRPDKPQELLLMYQGRVFSEELKASIVTCAPHILYAIPIWLEGEIGAGKELLARSIHQSLSNSGEFINVDSNRVGPTDLESLFATISDTLRNTVFLRNVDALDSNAQERLLRFTNDDTARRQINLIVTTNKDLKPAVVGGHFNPELYTSLLRGHTHLPSLREQEAAICKTFQWFVENMPPLRSLLFEKILRAKDTGVNYGEDVEAALLSHIWPLNYDELRSCAYRMYVDSRWHRGLISGSMVRHYIKKTAVTMPSSEDDSVVDSQDQETAIRHRVSDILRALRQGERRLYESLPSYLRRIGIQGLFRKPISRRVVLAYARFSPTEKTLMRNLGFVHGKPSTRLELESAEVNTNNFTSFLNALDLRQTTVRNPVRIADLHDDERKWLRSLRRKQVLT